MAALLDGTGGMERENLLRVAGDYAWRGYCVRFHIPEEGRGEYPKGDPLLGWRYVERLYSGAKFPEGSGMMGFKLTLVRAILGGAPEESREADRQALIDGFSCAYLFGWERISRFEWIAIEAKRRRGEVAPASALGAGERARRGFAEGDELAKIGETNPLAAYFAGALEREYGIERSRIDPELAAAVSVAGKLGERRSAAERERAAPGALKAG